MSHSKRNTSLAFFTSYERSLLRGDYGRQRTRLTRDSFKPLDACNLCMLRARDPVSCPSGDLFCRECALENLMAQRKEIARMQADLDRRRRDEDEEYARTEEAARERSVRDFELLQMGLEIRNRTAARGGRGVQQQRVVGREGGKILLEEVVAEGEEAGAGAENGDADAEKARGTKRKFELDEDELLRLALEERRRAKIEISAEEAAKKAVKLPSFWVPSLTPSVAAEDMPAPLPKLMPVCPASDKNHIHHYSLKGLVAIKFTEDEDEREKHGDKQRVCPACKKGLNNAAKAMLAVPCGHVLCKPCADKFMNPAAGDDPHDTTGTKPGDLRCYVCDEDLAGKSRKKDKKKRDKERDRPKPGLVLIRCDGTGFSAGGGNVTTERQGIAFQC